MSTDVPGVVDPVQLSLFGHRFMGIAEQVSFSEIVAARRVHESYAVFLDGPDLADDVREYKYQGKAPLFIRSILVRREAGSQRYVNTASPTASRHIFTQALSSTRPRPHKKYAICRCMAA